MYSLRKTLFILSAVLLPSLITKSHSTNIAKPEDTMTDNPGNYLYHKYTPNRRQYPGVNQQFRPPSDLEIARLLNQYRGIVKKHGERDPKAFEGLNNGQKNQADVPPLGNKTDRFNLGYRGPIRHRPLSARISKSTGMARQGEDTDQTTLDAQFLPHEEESPGTIQPQTTLNEAQGAASRFTTRRTTTRRRRRTTPVRVSFSEDCDYIAYYCLKAYDTGTVCGRTLYFVHMTFKNYCMLDYVNCMERYDIWQIAHMGDCFEIKILTEYLHYPYNDDYFLDNYYVVEDM